MSEWLEAITALRQQRAEKPPKGFKTRAEIAAEMGVGRARAIEILSVLTRAGHAESREFAIEIAGQLRRVPHYRLKK